MKLSAMFLVGLVVMSLHADTLVLKNGQRISGTYLGGDRASIRFQRDGANARTFRLVEVDGLLIGTYDGQTGASDRQRDGFGNRSASPAGPASVNDVAIPAGTVVTIRTLDRIDSNAAQAGETFRATVDDAVVINGRTVIPSGADATLRVIRVEQSGTVRGSEEIALQLESIRGTNGSLMIQSAQAQVSARSRGKESAAVIGGTAAVGAIIGAIAGGGKGAAIGAASGAGAGAAVQAIRGQRIKIEPESRLDFTVTQDVLPQ